MGLKWVEAPMALSLAVLEPIGPCSYGALVPTTSGKVGVYTPVPGGACADSCLDEGNRIDTVTLKYYIVYCGLNAGGMGAAWLLAAAVFLSSDGVTLYTLQDMFGSSTQIFTAITDLALDAGVPVRALCMDEWDATSSILVPLCDFHIFSGGTAHVIPG
jgi:hypothetical protein